MKKNQIKIFTFIIVISTFFCGFWLLLEEQKKRLSSSTKKLDEIIGQIQTLKNDSLKNDSREIFWSELKSREQIYFGDAIQTQSDSIVKIKLLNQQTLTIEPDTLVRFNKKDDDISLDLLQGEVKLTETAVSAPTASSAAGTNSPAIKRKKIYIQTQNGLVNAEKEKIFKITKKTKTNTQALFVDQRTTAHLNFDDDLKKTEQLIPPPPTAPAPEASIAPTPLITEQGSSTHLPASTIEPQPAPEPPPAPAPPVLAAPKIKKMKLSAEE